MILHTTTNGELLLKQKEPSGLKAVCNAGDMLILSLRWVDCRSKMIYTMSAAMLTSHLRTITSSGQRYLPSLQNIVSFCDRNCRADDLPASETILPESHVDVRNAQLGFKCCALPVKFDLKLLHADARCRKSNIACPYF
jgi:hypothetical protein